MNAFILTGCLYFLFALQTARSPSPDIESTNEDYAIYSEVLNQYSAKAQIKYIVIGDHTMMDFPPIMMGMTQFGDSAEMRKIRETATKQTLEDYAQKNKTPVLLKNKFSTRVPVVLVSETERDRIFEIRAERDKKTANRDGLKELQRLYPNSQGFMNLSRIGYDKNATKALVYVGNVCGGLCGSGQFFLLGKEDGTWKVKLSATTWVS